MFDFFGFISDNIFILVPIAIFLGFRILEARKKAGAASPKPQSAANLFSDDEDEEEDEQISGALRLW